MKKDSEPYKRIRIYCYICWIDYFLAAFFIGVFLLYNLEKDETDNWKIYGADHGEESQGKTGSVYHAL